VHPRFC
jgi:hypothetical protein